MLMKRYVLAEFQKILEGNKMSERPSPEEVGKVSFGVEKLVTLIYLLLGMLAIMKGLQLVYFLYEIWKHLYIFLYSCKIGSFCNL